MTLALWQSRLSADFHELLRKRNSAPLKRPIFGLEHGLEDAELLSLKQEIRAHIAKEPLYLEHALPWVVYASEIGYGYSGDEYWQTFEEQTPGWSTHGDRYSIRKCFRIFQDKWAYLKYDRMAASARARAEGLFGFL